MKVLVLGQDPYHEPGQVCFYLKILFILQWFFLTKSLFRQLGAFQFPHSWICIVAQAHGLSFSVPRAFSPLPGSLRNMYKSLEQDVPGFKAPTHGCLEAWARRGVLLLNATLTVQYALLCAVVPLLLMPRTSLEWRSCLYWRDTDWLVDYLI